VSGPVTGLEEVFRGDIERISQTFIQAFDLAFASKDLKLSYSP
jgi:hypothetical protein